MKIKIVCAACLLILVGGAHLSGKETIEPVGAAGLGPELADLEQDYHQGAIDEQQYFAKREMLLTAWELTLMDGK